MASEEKQKSPVAFRDQQYDAQPSFKIFVGIDFGTDGSGLAYALQSGETFIHNLWKDVPSTEKPKTSVLFDNHGEVQCHGHQAVIQYISSMSNDGWKLFERFKMKLYADPLWKSEIHSVQHSVEKVDIEERIESTNDPSMSAPSETVFVAQLQFLKSEAMSFILRNFRRKKRIQFTPDDIQWILTVPAIWSDRAKQRMKDWAVAAGLVEGHITSQLKMVYEPDCASLSIQHALRRHLEQKRRALTLDVDGDDINGPIAISESEALSMTESGSRSVSGRSPRSRGRRNRKHILKAHRPEIALDVPFEVGDQYVLLDVGGGTCDVAAHEIMGEFAIAEVLHPSGDGFAVCMLYVGHLQF